MNKSLHAVVMPRFLALSRREFSALVVGFALTLPVVTAHLYSSDEVQYFAYLRSMWFDRDVSFENEYRYFYERGWTPSPGFYETFLDRPRRNWRTFDARRMVSGASSDRG